MAEAPEYRRTALEEHPSQGQTSNIGPPTPATAASPTSATNVTTSQSSTVSLLERPGNRALWDSLPRSLAEVEQRQAEEEKARAAMSADLARVHRAQQEWYAKREEKERARLEMERARLEKERAKLAGADGEGSRSGEGKGRRGVVE